MGLTLFRGSEGQKNRGFSGFRGWVSHNGTEIRPFPVTLSPRAYLPGSNNPLWLPDGGASPR